MPTARSVYAVGNNVFGQIRADPDACVSDVAGLAEAAEPFKLADVAEVIACCTTQTIYRSQDGHLKVLGQATDHVQKTIEALHADNAEATSWVGYDDFIAALTPRRTYFASTVVGDTRGWKHAASDGRGRIIAIDLQLGALHLFDSLAQFQRGSLLSEDDFCARHRMLSPAETDLPSFKAISAGWAHFLLLADTAEAPIWVLGDTRFGAVPLHPWPGTLLTGHSSIVPSQKLLPVPFFDRSEGFPSRCVAVCAGSRHNLVLTQDGDVYGWGWNEDTCLLPISTDSTTDNIVSDPESIVIGKDEIYGDSTVISMAASAGRSFLVTLDGKWHIAGSNEFGCCGVSITAPSSLRVKPKIERDFSQIKKAYQCLDGFQRHSWPANFADGRAVAVHASAFATFITLSHSAALP